MNNKIIASSKNSIQKYANFQLDNALWAGNIKRIKYWCKKLNYGQEYINFLIRNHGDK